MTMSYQGIIAVGVEGLPLLCASGPREGKPGPRRARARPFVMAAQARVAAGGASGHTRRNVGACGCRHAITNARGEHTKHIDYYIDIHHVQQAACSSHHSFGASGEGGRAKAAVKPPSTRIDVPLMSTDRHTQCNNASDTAHSTGVTFSQLHNIVLC